MSPTAVSTSFPRQEGYAPGPSRREESEARCQSAAPSAKSGRGGGPLTSFRRHHLWTRRRVLPLLSFLPPPSPAWLPSFNMPVDAVATTTEALAARTGGEGLETPAGTLYVSKPFRSKSSKKLRALITFTPRKSAFDTTNELSGANEFRVRAVVSPRTSPRTDLPRRVSSPSFGYPCSSSPSGRTSPA